MAVQPNFYGTRMITVVEGANGRGSNFSTIPNPSLQITDMASTTTGGTLSVLIDASATFETDFKNNKIAIGDTVRIPSDFKYTTIKSIDSETQMTMNESISLLFLQQLTIKFINQMIGVAFFIVRLVQVILL